MEDFENQQEAPKKPDGKACVVRCMQEERQARCRKLRAEAEQRVQKIKDDCWTRIEEILFAGRSGFVDIIRQINAAVVHPARREADAIAARQMGEGVDSAMKDCLEKCKEFARSKNFEPVLQSLIMNAAAAAEQLAGENDEKDLGKILVSSEDADTCRALVHKLKLPLKVVEDETVWGGAVIVTPGGEHRIYNTLSTRMQKKEYELRAAATGIIQKAFNRNASSNEQS